MIGPNVVIGPNVIISEGVRIKDSTLLEGCIVKKYSFIEGSIIGWRSIIGSWTRVNGLTILGEDVVLSDEINIIGSVILPNVSVKNSLKEGTILLS